MSAWHHWLEYSWLSPVLKTGSFSLLQGGWNKKTGQHFPSLRPGMFNQAQIKFLNDNKHYSNTGSCAVGWNVLKRTETGRFPTRTACFSFMFQNISLRCALLNTTQVWLWRTSHCCYASCTFRWLSCRWSCSRWSRHGCGCSWSLRCLCASACSSFRWSWFSSQCWGEMVKWTIKLPDGAFYSCLKDIVQGIMFLRRIKEYFFTCL